MSHRKALREAGRAAMAAAFPTFATVSLWALPMNSRDLPAWAVGTPRETSGAQTKSDLDRQVTLDVVVKTIGADLEDALDEIAAVVEASVIPALIGGACRYAELSETLVTLAREGEQAVGQIVLRITCAVDTEIPY